MKKAKQTLNDLTKETMDIVLPVEIENLIKEFKEAMDDGFTEDTRKIHQCLDLIDFKYGVIANEDDAAYIETMMSEIYDLEKELFEIIKRWA